ncbi:MAG: Uracil-DNA glycosylase [Chlamydiae bacterium]|nr:Uracil-DNA glycosylase [Chlamydiota bacterium]
MQLKTNKQLHTHIEPSWQAVLKEEFEKPYMQELALFLKEERSNHIPVYPEKKDVFHAFDLCPFDQLNVVIIGQDPYHNPNQAHGLCFSVKHGIKPPPSLVNIYKELKADLGICPPEHGNLEAWAKQGVLLLNATMTVRAHSPKSHYGKGWERFTDKVCECIVEKKDPVVFVLWGKSAQDKCLHILNEANTHHLILKAAHPSPYSAERFFGCRHFSKINRFLKQNGKKEILWQL